MGILDFGFWDFGDFGFWLVGFWGFWILGILGIWGILDFGILGILVILVILEILDFGILGSPGDVPPENLVTLPGGQRLESTLVCLWGPLQNQLYLIDLGQGSKLSIFSEVKITEKP